MGEQHGITAPARRALTAIGAAGLTPPPADWQVVSTRSDRHNDTPVSVTRFQPAGYRLGIPHLTVVLDGSDTVLGYTFLSRPSTENAAVPDEPTARGLAYAFIEAFDPAYAKGLTTQWTARHDEAAEDEQGRFVMPGTKVKTRHDSGLYAWAVIGADGRVLTWERDIAWDFGESRRATRMWLHDSWIAAFDGLGPAPGAPYART